MAKLRNTTSAVYEFIHDQTVANANGKRLHEFDIVGRFRPIIGHAATIDILERLSKKHNVLKSTSTKKVSTGRETYYYRANPDNPYYDTGKGRATSPETMKKLEKLRNVPLADEPDQGQPEKLTKSVKSAMELLNTPIEVKIESISAEGTQTSAPVPEPQIPASVISMVTGVSEEEGRNSVSLMLDLGASRTEVVDVNTAYKLYLGLKAVFDRNPS